MPKTLTEVESADRKVLERIKKYPQADLSTLEYDETLKRFKVSVKCEGCKRKIVVYTSDLFQKKFCRDCMLEIRKKKAKKRRREATEALKIVSSTSRGVPPKPRCDW